MFPDRTDLSLYFDSLQEASKMLKKSAVTSLVVICVTIVISLWLVRDSLCGVSYESGGTILKATLAYESR